MHLVRFVFILFTELLLSMGDPSFLPGNAPEETDFPNMTDLSQVDATILQLDQEESQSQEEAPEKEPKQQEEKP